MKDLHLLPKVRDSWSYLYAEHCKIDQEDKAIAVHDAQGTTPVPCASLSVLLLGPGTSITHAAIRALADNGCLVIWGGEEGVRTYAQGLGETRSARNLIRQARLCTDAGLRLKVVTKMYRMRFRDEPLPGDLTLQQLRGREGIRVRTAYAQASRESGVSWRGRTYDRGAWSSADPVNRALSAANSCLYGICHAAIVAAGYSPGLGFIHTGKMLSFVYDIADLYKAELTIPLAFRAAAQGTGDLEGRVRRACREAFHGQRILQRIIPDIEAALEAGGLPAAGDDDPYATDEAQPGALWDPEIGPVAGGVNRAEEADTGAGSGR